jgi:hypothetical protein
VKDVEEIAAEQYLYWRSCGRTHSEMLAEIRRPHSVGMTGDDVVAEIMAVWQSLYRNPEKRDFAII